MDRLDGLLGNRSGSKNGETNSVEPCRKPRVNFNEQPNRRKTFGSTRGSSTGNRPASNERSTQDTHATGRCDSMNWNQANQGRNYSRESNRRENPEPLSRGNDAQAGHSMGATSMATAFEPSNRSLVTFVTRLSRTSERSEKSRRGFKKPRRYKDESDGCIDIWIDVKTRMQCAHQQLGGDSPKLRDGQKQYQWDTAEKIVEILLNRFGYGLQGRQAMMNRR